MKKFLLPLILALAFGLRVFFLSSIPSGFTPDEASFGYDAYSILKTGKDQWGKSFPILFESFGDFKSPVYGYLTIPTVAIFGLNKFAVRLPSALLGTVGILITYLLVKQLFGKRKFTVSIEHHALSASFLLAISPWHLALSRGAFEANLTTFFLPLGVFLFLKGLEKQKFLLWAAIIFGLNLFTYHSAKIVTPFVLIILVLFYKSKILQIYKNKLVQKSDRKTLLYSFLIFGVFLIMTIYSFSIGAGRRASDINIYNGSLVQAFDERMRMINSGANPLVAHLRYNKYTITLKRFYVNYTSYFSPKFLFIKGPAEATYGMIPGFGVLYGVELVFLFGFIYSVVHLKQKEGIFILFWILFAPVPAALSSGVGYAANRVAVMMPAIQIASALGLMVILESITRIKPNLRYFIMVLTVLLIGYGSFVFMRKYFDSANAVVAKQMLFGNLEATEYVAKNYSDKKVIMSTGLSEPHIYWAFETKIDPDTFQSSTKMWDYKEKNLPFLDQLPEYTLGNIIFKRIDWKKDPKNVDVIIGRPDEFPKGVLVTKVFYYPDSTAAIYLVDIKNQSYAKANYAKAN